MPGSLSIHAGLVLSFLLSLARVSGALAFMPLPGLKSAPEMTRAGLAISLTLALYSSWPQADPGSLTAFRLAGSVLAEAAIGLAIGIFVSLALETFAVAAQILGLQAGYAYASTINPETDADSGVLLIMAQTLAGLLFFALGLDRELVRLLARSFDVVPAASWSLNTRSAESLIGFGGNLFSVGVRVALPVVALLLMVDVSLALLGRLNQQLQLLSLAFPVKMLLALVVFAWIASVFPDLVLEVSRRAFAAIGQALAL